VTGGGGDVQEEKEEGQEEDGGIGRAVGIAPIVQGNEQVQEAYYARYRSILVQGHQQFFWEIMSRCAQRYVVRVVASSTIHTLTAKTKTRRLTDRSVSRPSVRSVRILPVPLDATGAELVSDPTRTPTICTKPSEFHPYTTSNLLYLRSGLFVRRTGSYSSTVRAARRLRGEASRAREHVWFRRG